jgi:tRNA(Ile)-lysidine synthase
MLEDFKNHISQVIKLEINSKILLAVSGGADSVLMLHLFWKAGYDCGIAHCNFKLRDSDSDLDEELVTKLAGKYQFPLFKTSFDTANYAQDKGISIEMAARDLRYTWFEEVRKANSYQYIATAHHQDDVIETFFINLLRGTGIRGLSGIGYTNGAIVRPMLFTNRESVMKTIEKEELEYRHDLSNFETNIIRNKLRHNIIPILDEINASSRANILRTIENLKDAGFLMNREMERIRKEIIKESEDYMSIEIASLIQFPNIHAVLFELLSPLGFNREQIMGIELSLYGHPGKSFYSKSHWLIKDREYLNIKPLENTAPQELLIVESDGFVQFGANKSLKFSSFDITEKFIIPRERHIAALDFGHLKFPLKIRNWEPGDFFFPLGMAQKKKVSDFLVDEKISLVHKQNTYVLLSGNQIVWVIGERIDNRFKITKETTKVFQIIYSR